MFEFYLSFTSFIVFATNCGLVNSFILNGYISISSILPNYGQQSIAAAFLHKVATLLKLERSRLIIIKDGDLHNASSAQFHFHSILSRNHRELQEKLLVWFPLVVINNCHSNLFFCFMGFKSKNLVDSFIVLSLISRPVNSLNPHSHCRGQLSVPADKNLECSYVLHHSCRRCMKFDD